MDKNDKAILSMIVKCLRLNGQHKIVDIIKSSRVTIETYDYNNWNGGEYYATINLYMGLIQFNTIIEKEDICNQIFAALRSFYNEGNYHITDVKICAEQDNYLDWDAIVPITKRDLLNKLSADKNYLIDIATGTSIDAVITPYKSNNTELRLLFCKLGIDFVHSYFSPWDWYNDYKNRLNLTTYSSRRDYLNKLYHPIEQQITESDDMVSIGEYDFELTGWGCIDNALMKMRETIFTAKETLDYQNVGLIARNILIELGRLVYSAETCGEIFDGKTVGRDDSARMLQSYISHKLTGNSNDKKRKFVKTTVDLAHELTHKIETANQLDAQLCFYSIIATVRVIKAIDTYFGT